MKSISYSLLMALVFFAGCQGKKAIPLGSYYARLDAIPKERWEALAQKKIFFGHKSVGMNILDGLRDVIKERPLIKLDIREADDPAAFSSPVFAHALVGTNSKPETKIERFQEIMRTGVGEAVDIAMLKFCFVDVGHSTDIEALAQSYAEGLDLLSGEFPGVKFVAFTVPLFSDPVGWKNNLKKLLGRLPFYDADQVQRSLYNDLIRERLKGSLFDIAAVGSRINEGKKATLKKDGREYEILYKGYTYDGGHLNLIGRQVFAIELLIHLASII